MNWRKFRLAVQHWVIAVVCAVSVSVHGGDLEKEALQKSLDALFDAPQWSNSYWGVQVLDLDTSEVLYERLATKNFTPASNLKLYTTAAALKLLGPEYRFETPIYANGPVRSRILYGDLVVVGCGDPSISGRYNPDQPTTAILQQWVGSVKAAGIREIRGAVIGDDDCFDDQARAGSWQLDYYQEWYAAESSGLAINENCWDVTVRPGKKPGQRAVLEPSLPSRYVTFKNEIITTAPTDKPDEDPPIEIIRPLDSNVVTLRGFIPVNLPSYKMWGSVHNGTLWSTTLFVEALERAGIRVHGGAMDVDDLPNKERRLRRESWRLIHKHVSPPLKQIIAIVNKPSQNFYADQLLKVLGRHRSGVGSFAAGEKAVKEFLQQAGIDATSLRMLDGSGLSRQNVVQPRMTVSLLAYMAWQPEFKAFYESLPIAGVDGTLKKRMRNTPAENNVHAKTGYIGRVRCLSGYATTRDQHRVAFSMMANQYTVDTRLANDTQDSATLLLVNYSAGLALPEQSENLTTATASPEITRTDYTIEQSARGLRFESEPGGRELPQELP
ncbi:MAG: D-alanyl-D-alanine carboxypeptidase/D-alanyl-D-alanine-endopeptidase [Candidatus Hydrogenedentota bacterium]|uniref:D-alanyl-D-alanine carboxypeptidase n=1 Tax=Sumerlaea chitinivorans TaxID=2250252 RepID=A0A2Z4Y4E3_SUMC1|nr:D-alanyl-D-alanine carboxypeptidase [Candidatus Sumerlaea chitinivorans]MCX7964766.1 D-alanyl-D-alanine carboxypeptidase/D-alanyl-D-alanine-endopeptidase [Candidatus Sumerlaea chitinivorans]RMH27659.1 MAG: D-alanyl-D-alanine carboxypeptidase/D-alanyl-D-alanine-endopeptidase [Candidatus Hydrogenedentota bacterium]GIX44032.1 MAG: peptidase M15 [Candidatus Sumerlaea sp.]